MYIFYLNIVITFDKFGIYAIDAKLHELDGRKQAYKALSCSVAEIQQTGKEYLK